tara:strand:- start:11851 stop:12843 length:993 start_codon:yes stop_codon:yes gene_type:complete
MTKIKAEYVWLDGTEDLPKLRSKTRIIDSKGEVPEWGFDGGSTYQSANENSDLVLKPARVYRDPFRGEEDVLIMCEVLKADGNPHPTNTREALLDMPVTDAPIFGFEQEYTMMANEMPIAWHTGKSPAPQGDYYCGVGFGTTFGRNLVEDHLTKCIEAGVDIYGVNAEVMPSQWEFQTTANEPLKAADDLWVARYILERLGENYGCSISYAPKPLTGEWNGAGCHTNFSTQPMRENWEAIETAIERLRARHEVHMLCYGAENEKRLTGDCETSDLTKFTVGERDRSCSIRIPASVARDKKGYIEDRRPGANIDPYRVCTRILKSVCLDQD